MTIESLWERIKHVLNRPIGLSATDKLKTISPMTKADDMLKTAIFDLSEAIKESKKDHDN